MDGLITVTQEIVSLNRLIIYVMKQFLIKLGLAGILFFSQQHHLLAQDSDEADKIVYSQKVNRFNSIFEPWNAFRGTLTLRENTIHFEPKNNKEKGAFSLEYEDIDTVKKGLALILPNKIIIVDNNYSKYKLGTYKRKQIVEIIQSKIAD